MKLPVFVAPVRNMAREDIDQPVKQVQCHCPQACWVALTTIAACAKAGAKPTYYCPGCCPDEIRPQIQLLANEAKARIAAGDPSLPVGEPVGGVIYGVRNYNFEEGEFR